jgi:hypothetical protein
VTATVPGVRLGYQLSTVGALNQLVPRVGAAGMVLGFDRRQRPVALRVHGGEAARVALIGGLRCAQLLALRAAGAGLHVLVRSPRPAAWEVLARSVNTPREVVSLADPNGPPQRRAQPLAVVRDADPNAGEPAPPAERARLTFLVREELTTWGASALGWADVVILQSPSEAEAALAARALGIAPAQADLARMPSEITAVVSQGSVHWVRLQPTPVELDLLGPPARH